MNNEISNLLSSISQQVFAFCQSESGMSRLSAKQRSVLGEAGLAISQTLTNLNLLPRERTLLEKAFNSVFSAVYDDNALFYYSSFYYSLGEVKKDANKVQIHFIKANADIVAMRMKLAAVKMGFASFGTSTDNYFLGRLSGLVNGIEFIFRNQKTEYYTPAIYALLNLHQTLLDFQENNIANPPEVLSSLSSVHEALEKILALQGVQAFINGSPQARFFLVEQFLRYAKLNSKTTIQDFDLISFEKLDWIPQLRCLSSISQFRPDEFLKGFDVCFPKWKSHYAEAQPPTKILLLNVLIQWQRIVAPSSTPGLNLLAKSDNSVNIRQILSRFFNGYDRISQTKISSSEIENCIPLMMGSCDIKLVTQCEELIQ